MIHYNVWFSFRSDVDEREGLTVIRNFLRELQSMDDIAGFQLLRNSGTGAGTRMPPFQALIEFRDDAQFSAGFSAQAARGIHTGLHRRVISLVGEFQIEVFREIAAPAPMAYLEQSYQYACEV